MEPEQGERRPTSGLSGGWIFLLGRTPPGGLEGAPAGTGRSGFASGQAQPGGPMISKPGERVDRKGCLRHRVVPLPCAERVGRSSLSGTLTGLCYRL
jgi:hypothetical protein